MGTVSSVSRDINTNKISDSQDESSEFDLKLLNSLKKMNNKYQSQAQSETRENTKVTVINDQKISYKFEWKDGGNEVKIAGSFLDNWSRQEEMKKNLSSGIYEIIIELPKGIHQFKFIVDNQWVCSQYYTIIHDNLNNSNNIIDLTNYINENNDSNIKKKKKKSGKDHIDYSCKYPNSTEINLEAPPIPSHYFSKFNLNFQTKQEIIKNYFKQKPFINKSKNILENNTFKSIVTLSHEKVSHICFNCENNNNNETYIRTSMTHRNKHKFITLVYFTPKK